ncbi:MAG TPA: ATP-binding cassette domain-containing protein [Gammaproteobacteria bacterium]|nr:ATP-binding cassette domain-containing protein [Gammaproteobacteria bacterium]
MIEFQQVSKQYASTHALKDINFTVQKGEIVGVIGKSGAGKSTLIRCANLLEKPSSGKVFVADQELTALSASALRDARKHIGMIFQQFNLLNSKTVFENVALPLKLDHQKTDKILGLLELVGLSDKKDQYPAQLSGGQKQRVAIARALALDPKVLLCDEATSALDPQNTEAILTLLKKINIELGLTILLITHEMHVVKHSCDRVIVLDDGQIVEEGKIADVFAAPQKAITQYFVDSALRAELPGILQEKIFPAPAKNTIPVWRIYFKGHAAAEPIITQLAREYELNLNILQASLECIQHLTLGIMIVAVDAAAEKHQAGLDFLAQKNLKVEIIGYVARETL